MAEATIVTALQTIIRSVSGFTSASVTIEDWSVLDGSLDNDPFFILEMSDEFRSRQDTKTDTAIWNIRGSLYVKFTEWAASRSTLRTHRQAILDKFNEVGTARSAGGLEATDINEIRNGGPITPVYLVYNSQDYNPESVPILLSQELVFVCEEYG